MNNQLALFDPVMTLVASNIKGREATKEESVIIDSAWQSAENNIRALAWLSREGKTYKHIINPNTGEAFASFEEYGKVRFGYEKTQLNALANAYRVENDLVGIPTKEMPLSHTEPFRSLKDGEIPERYQRAIELAKEEGVKLGARHVEQSVKELQEKARAAETQLQATLIELKQEKELTEAVKEQRDRMLSDKEKQLKLERETRQSVIDAKAAEAKAQALLDAQAEIQKAKDDAAELEKKIAKLKKEQSQTVQQQVNAELIKLEDEVKAKHSTILNYQKEIDELKQTKTALDQQVGNIQEHKRFIKDAKQEIANFKTSVMFAQEIGEIPSEVYADWKAIAVAARNVADMLENWVIESSVIENTLIIEG